MKTATTAPRARARTSRYGVRCHRCNGLMLPEQLYGEALEVGPMDGWGWRCVICGDLIDPLILRHRHQQRTAADLETAVPSQAG